MSTDNPPAMFVACDTEHEPDGAVCPGVVEFGPDDRQAACSTCGAWRGRLAPSNRIIAAPSSPVAVPAEPECKHHDPMKVMVDTGRRRCYDCGAVFPAVPAEAKINLAAGTPVVTEAPADLADLDDRAKRAYDWVQGDIGKSLLPLSVRKHFEQDWPALVTELLQLRTAASLLQEETAAPKRLLEFERQEKRNLRDELHRNLCFTGRADAWTLNSLIVEAVEQRDRARADLKHIGSEAWEQEQEDAQAEMNAQNRDDSFARNDVWEHD